MKANQFAKDEAVSTVVGGLLFFALVIMFLVVVRVEFAPVWQEEDEAKHMNTIQGQFAALKSEADRQAANTTQQPIAMPLTLLERTTSRFFTPTNLPANVEFSPGSSDLIVSSNEFLLFESGGTGVFGIDETWTDVGGGQNINDADEVRHLRLRLLDPGNEDHGDSVTLTVTDSNGEFAGDMTTYIDTFPSGYAINTKIRSADLTVLYDQGESLFQQNQPAFWWVDAMGSELHFVDILAAASKPLDIALSESGMSGQFTVTYVDGSGTVSGGSGNLDTNFYESRAGGRLRFASTNQNFPQQDYVLEAGAVILVQPDGAVMRTDSIFEVSTTGSQTKMRVTLPSLQGEADSVSGSGAATIVLDAIKSTHITGTAPRLDISLETSYPTAWADMWERKLTAAGLTAAAGHFDIDTTATHATLVVYGQTTSPSSTVHDLNVRLDIARVDVQLRT